MATFYLNTLTFQDEETKALIEKMENATTRRLWHQLTVFLRKFVKISEVQPKLFDIYNNYIVDVESRFNQFQLVEIFIHVLSNVNNLELSMTMLDTMSEKVSKTKIASQLIKITRAQIILENCSDETNLRKVREIVNELSPELEKEDGVSEVHSRYYEMAAHYYSKQSNHEKFYRNTLRYLGCREDLSKGFDATYEPIGFKLCLAALLADNVYNFGELLQHKILNPVRDGPNKWIVALLLAFNTGDIETVKELSPQWESQNDLLAHKEKLTEKWMLSALMESVFSRSAKDRILTFEFIATRTGLELNKVEWLIMRALALKLVKGFIDQVDQTATINWVQPRVLDKNQISKMANKVKKWAESVDSKENIVEQRAHEIVQF